MPRLREPLLHHELAFPLLQPTDLCSRFAVGRRLTDGGAQSTNSIQSTPVAPYPRVVAGVKYSTGKGNEGPGPGLGFPGVPLFRWWVQHAPANVKTVDLHVV